MAYLPRNLDQRTVACPSSAVAKAVGKGDGFDFGGPEAIWNEVRAVWPEGRGMSYARLEREGLRWPCPTEDHPGTDILHRDGFTAGPRAHLRRVDFKPTAEGVSDQFPLLLTTGRTLYQFNAGTMTGRTPNLVLRPADFLDMAPIDAARLSFADGDRVRVVSRYGSAVLPVRITDAVNPGEPFATFHTPDVFLNHVIGPLRDRFTDTHEYKVTAVQIEKA